MGNVISFLGERGKSTKDIVVLDYNVVLMATREDGTLKEKKVTEQIAYYDPDTKWKKCTRIFVEKQNTHEIWMSNLKRCQNNEDYWIKSTQSE